MKKLLLSLCLCIVASTGGSQVIELTAKFRGHYWGELSPVGKLSNERLIIEFDVDAYGHVDATVYNFDLVEGPSYSAEWPFFTKTGRFNTNVSGIGDQIKGTFTSTGTVTGTAKSDDGIRYTFKAWRQYKVPQ